MESIGEFFKQVREDKGLTIDNVASKTRIRTDFVKAMEEGNFAKLPDQVFARGFVRSYARSLGLDEDDAIHRFTQSAGAYYDKQGERERLKVKQAEEERKRQSNRKAVAIAIGIAILTLIFLLSREQSSLLVRRSNSDFPASTSKRTAPPISESQDIPSKQAEAIPPVPLAPTPSTAPSTLPRPNPVTPLPCLPRWAKDIMLDPWPLHHPQLRLRRNRPAPAPASLGSDGPLGGISLEGSGVPDGSWRSTWKRQS